MGCRFCSAQVPADAGLCPQCGRHQPRAWLSAQQMVDASGVIFRCSSRILAAGIFLLLLVPPLGLALLALGGLVLGASLIMAITGALMAQTWTRATTIAASACLFAVFFSAAVYLLQRP